jgi:hypothetical protein
MENRVGKEFAYQVLHGGITVNKITVMPLGYIFNVINKRNEPWLQ